jgi:hypothetical protein
MENGTNVAASPERALFESIGQSAEDVDKFSGDGEDSQTLVEEIESMCINCEENVQLAYFWGTNDCREPQGYSLPKSLSSEKSSSCPSLALTAVLSSFTSSLIARLRKFGNPKRRGNPTTRREIPIHHFFPTRFE